LRNVDTNTLIDCGAEGTFINQNFVRANRIPVTRLKKPIEVFNVDGTPNKKGEITQYTRLKVTVKGRKRRILFLVTSLGKESVIFGMPWFQKENPLIDWELRTLEWRPPKEDPKSGKPPLKPNSWIEEEDDEPYLETLSLSLSTIYLKTSSTRFGSKQKSLTRKLSPSNLTPQKKKDLWKK
jgi:hypothetical protein